MQKDFTAIPDVVGPFQETILLSGQQKPLVKTINLLLAVHNHQPVGNFDFVFQEAFERAYKPFLDILEKHPRIKISLHFSGILLDWLDEHQLDFLSRVSTLVTSGQLQLLTGSYYEAILPVLREEDRRGQIKKLTGFIKNRFRTAPVGMWLAERVWEQQIARALAESGVKFIPLDEAHFLAAGLSETDLLGYYVTEEQGKTLVLFPASKRLRYTIPFQPVSKTIDFLRSLATESGNRVITFADDGEKFGGWPTTYKHVYEDGWLEEFFKALEENSSWLQVRHFTEFMEEIRAVGRIYLPNASYPEMMHWVLPPQAFGKYDEFSELLKDNKSLSEFEQFVRGGFWRNFFAKYPEANTLHKKMLRISERAHTLKNRGKRVKSALEHLWAGQCNDAYWHGVFGGLYLPHLRTAAFRNLLRAEGALNDVEKFHGIRVEEKDFDCDGRDELLIESPTLNVYIKPDHGGSVFEFDYLPTSSNLGNVMTRREESYHKKLRESEKKEPSSSSSQSVASIHDLVLKKEENLGEYLSYDWYRRASFLDHLLGDNVTLEDFSRCKYAEQGDFVNQQYQHRVLRKGNSVRINLWREGNVWHRERHLPLRVSKTLSLKRGSSAVEVEYNLENLGDEQLDLWFGIEFCFALSAGDAPDRYYRFDDVSVEDRRLRSIGSVDGVRAILLVDEWLGIEIRLEFDHPTTVWRFPIETVSMSEAGYERVYQGSVVFPNWHIPLAKKWNTNVHIELEKSSRQ